MRSRLLAFFIALVLSLPGVLGSGFSAAKSTGAAAVQEAGMAAESGSSTSALDSRSADVSSAGHGEVLLDVPELLNARSAPDGSGAAISRVRPLPDVVLSPPFLEGPQRPPCADRLFA